MVICINIVAVLQKEKKSTVGTVFFSPQIELHCSIIVFPIAAVGPRQSLPRRQSAADRTNLRQKTQEQRGHLATVKQACYNIVIEM